MKLKMFKKIVSLASAFTIVATCLAGLNFSVSAAADPYEGGDTFIPYSGIDIVKTAGDNFTIKPMSEGSKINGLIVDGIEIPFDDNNPNPTEKEKVTVPVTDEDGNPVLDDNGEEVTKVEEGEVPETKWVIESTTPGKASSNAFFLNEKDTSNKKNSGYSLKTVASSDLTKYGMSSMWEQTIGGLKAAGQFNSIVDVRLVSKNYSNPKKSDENDENGESLYQLKKGQKVYLSFRIYINPKGVDGPVLTAKKDTNTEAKGIVFKLPVYNTNGTVKTNADLTLDEGKSFKLPFKASSGDTGLTWTSNKPECFTVVNGTVKAIKAGSGTVTIKSINTPSSQPVKVSVTVKPAVAAIRTNVNTLNLITKLNNGKDTNGDIQYITVAPKTSTGAKIKYTLSLLKKSNGIKFYDSNGKALTSPVTTGEGGVLTFGVGTTSAFKNLEKGEKLVINAVCVDKSVAATKTIKDINVTLKTTTYPDYVKNFKETVKANKVTGFREVNVPVDGIAALNLSINPATAINEFTWDKLDIQDVVSDINTSKNGTIEISKNGDVIKGLTPGTCYYQATSTQTDKDGNAVQSSIYKINVYKPASSFEFNDGTDSKMVVKGGYLMEADNANKACDKKIIGGKRYTFTEPSCGANQEPVVWTSNKSGAIVFAKNGIMNLTVVSDATATYTITGTSQYTKQKYSFKVMAKESGEELNETSSNDKFVGIDNTLELVKGEKYQLIPDVAGIFDSTKNAKVTYIVDADDNADKKAISVNGSGVITANKATIDKAKVIATIPGEDPVEVDVDVIVTDATTAEPVASVNVAYVDGLNANGSPVTLTAKLNGKKVSSGVDWYIVNTTPDGEDYNITSDVDSKGKFVIPAYLKEIENTDDQGNTTKEIVLNDANIYNTPTEVKNSKKYEFYCVVNSVKSDPIEVNAYNGVMKKQPKIADPAKEPTYSGAVDLNTMKKAAGGVKAGSTFKLPIALDSKVTKTVNGKNTTVTLPNDLSVANDDIIWTSSNNYIINKDNIKPVERNDRIGSIDLPEDGRLGETITGTYYGKYYHEYEFTTSSEYTGKVTLTGITKNGGKKIQLTLYVVK